MCHANPQLPSNGEQGVRICSVVESSGDAVIPVWAFTSRACNVDVNVKQYIEVVSRLSEVFCLFMARLDHYGVI